MTYTTPDAQISSGQSVGTLALVTSLSASSIPFLEPNEFPANSYRRGEAKTTTTGVVRRSGYKSKTWVSGLLWLQQWEYLRANLEGVVTIRTRINSTTYSNYYAILDIGEIGEYELTNTSRYGLAIVGFRWNFTRVEAV